MIVETKHYPVIFGQANNEIEQILKQYKSENIFVLTDSNTSEYCLPRIDKLNGFRVLTIEPGEKNKTLATVEKIWSFLLENHADRHTLLINLGGGVITDLGGFAAATYKRGIDFVNIPTTLLAQVDASVGGKTGFNLLNYKNSIGLFAFPKAVIIDTILLETLPQRQLRSGFAEMIKHALIADEKEWKKLRSFPYDAVDYEYLSILVRRSVEIKKRFVEDDPYEKGIRKALNFGHTIGHAIETLLLAKNIEVLHGEAVAAGMVSETFLSNQRFILSIDKVFEISSFMSKLFPALPVKYDDYDTILEIMRNDKKNKDGKILFSLLKNIGQVETDIECTREEIIEALNFYFQFKG